MVYYWKAETINERAVSLSKLDSSILAIIIAKEFILDFIGIGGLVNVLLVLLIAFRLLTAEWAIPFFAYALCPFLVLQICVIALAATDILVGVVNLARLMQVALYALFLLFLMKRYPDALRNKYYSSTAFFNAVLLINCFVMVLQYIFPGSFVAAAEGGEIMMREDLISGTFGYASTHAVALFAAFVIIHDIDVYHKRSVDALFIPGVWLLAIISLGMALLNDNKALFIFLPLGAAAAIYFSKDEKNRRVQFRDRNILPLLALVFGAILLVGAIALIPQLRAFYDDTIGLYAEKVINALSLNAYVDGSDERFNILVYAPTLPEFYGFGESFGAADMYEPGFHNYNHFGQSDFGSIAILGGVWTLFAVILFYSLAFSEPERGIKRDRRIVVFFILLLTIMAVYVQPFSQVRIAIVAFLYCYAIRECAEKYV